MLGSLVIYCTARSARLLPENTARDEWGSEQSDTCLSRFLALPVVYLVGELVSAKLRSAQDNVGVPCGAHPHVSIKT